MILAISALCAALGLFESAAGVLMLTPFLLLVLPLLAGFDPAGPAVARLIGILDARRKPGAAVPRVAAGSRVRFRRTRITGTLASPRGPPAASYC